MKKLMSITWLSLSVLSANISANPEQKEIYINKNIGFNIEGYKYQQSAFPCEIDDKLVNLLIQESNRSGVKAKPVETKEEINNGVTPVLLVDIEQLTLSKKINYGKSKNFNLPKIQITAGILKGQDLQTAKHTCVSATHNKLTFPTDRVVLNHANILVCEEANRCLSDLSKDIVAWIKPQL